MVKWTELRAELEKSTGLSKNQLDRMIVKATRKKDIAEPQHDPATGNARLLSDADAAKLRARAAEMQTNPPAVPPQLARKPETPAPAGNGTAAEDQHLSVDELAESEGPKNTRKSLLDKKHDDEDDEEDDEPAKTKKPWVKWLLIGGLVLAGGLALMAFMRRRQANQIAGGGGTAQGIPAAPEVDIPQPSGPVALLSPQEVEQFRSAGIPIPGGPIE